MKKTWMVMMMPKNKVYVAEEENFYIGVRRFMSKADLDEIKEFWHAFNEYLIREIYRKDYCYLPYIGEMKSRKVESYVQKQKAPSGKMVSYVVPSRIAPVFFPSDDFIDDVNGEAVTKSYRKREKSGYLSQRDYERMCRTHQMEREGARTITEEELDKIKSDFRQSLRDKVAKFNKTNKN